MFSPPLPLCFIHPSLPSSWCSWHKSSTIPPSQFHLHLLLNNNNFTKRTSKCFTNNSSSSSRSGGGGGGEKEERLWVREEERWLREEQRWIREERRWEAQRETLLNQIKALNLQITRLQQQLQQQQALDITNNNNSSSSVLVNQLLHLLKNKDIAPLLLEPPPLSPPAAAAASIEEEEEETAVEEDVDNKVNEEEVKMITLRPGSEGHQVQMLQEALLKLGFYCGEEDEEFANFSSGTERAVKTWQSTIGVPETGIMTPELLQTLLFIDQQHPTSGSSLREGANGVAENSITQTPEIPLKTVKEVPEPDVAEHRVFLLGENRWEDSSRLKNQSSQTQPNSKGVVKTKCITCRGEGRLLCLECDGTGEPNIEPQFLEWVGEDTKCPYCEGDGHTICDVCQGTGAGAA